MKKIISKDQKEASFTENLNQSLESFEKGDASARLNSSLRMIIDFREVSYPESLRSNDSVLLHKKATRFFDSLNAICNLYPVRLQFNGTSFSLYFIQKDENGMLIKDEYDSFHADWFFRTLEKEGVLASSIWSSKNEIRDVHTDQELRLALIAFQRSLAYVFGYVDSM